MQISHLLENFRIIMGKHIKIIVRVGIFLILTALSNISPIFSQSERDALYVKEIYNQTLLNGKCYDWLKVLSEDIGGRLAGSTEAEKAVNYTYDLMKTIGFEHITKQECAVKKWSRGNKEEVYIYREGEERVEIPALTLGNSVGTDGSEVLGEVIELRAIDSLEAFGEEMIRDKIVFFNRPMDPTQLRTFHAYGGAVDQRVHGAAQAVKFGAKAVLVRSLTTLQDDYPHTGVTVYEEDGKKIPTLAISTNAANNLSDLLSTQRVTVGVKSYAQNLGAGISYNVIGEITGSEKPEEIILVGGHLDSWDIGGGAHDDGAGCVHALQAIHTLLAMGYKPKHTIRCIMFMNEENGLAGGLKYAKESNDKNEFHLAAIESDAGGFTPRGFSCDAEADKFNVLYKALTKFNPILEAYDLRFVKGGSGADINPLKSQGGLLIGFRPDSQRYFDYHHSAKDRIEAVNERELKLGAAAISSLIYLIDKYGL